MSTNKTLYSGDGEVVYPYTYGNNILDSEGNQMDIADNISTADTAKADEELVLASDDKTEEYVKMGDYGIKSKGYYDLDGNPIVDVVPDMFAEEMETTVASINEVKTTSSITFSIVTDVHERYHDSSDVKVYSQMFKNMKTVSSKCKIDGILNLGDSLSSSGGQYIYNSQDVVNAHLKLFWDRMQDANRNSIIILGNHDGIHAEPPTKNGSMPAIGMNCFCTRYQDAPFFFVNNSERKIRMIFLCVPYVKDDGNNTWKFGEEQIGWLINTALNTADGWHTIFFCHCNLVGTDLQNSDNDDVQGVINAYNNHTSFTTSYGQTADFTALTSTKAVAWICGHSHYDMVITDNSVFSKYALCCPIIVVGCANMYGGASNPPTGATSPTRNTSNYTRELWDTMVYRKDLGKIYMIRFGAGNDRVINV